MTLKHNLEIPSPKNIIETQDTKNRKKWLMHTYVESDQGICDFFFPATTSVVLSIDQTNMHQPDYI